MVVARSKTGWQIEIEAGNHRWLADEPLGVGDDAGPNPYDLLLGALAACTLMTVQMYARRKEWPLEGVTIRLDHNRVHADDCGDCETEGKGRVDIIEGAVEFFGPLDEEQLARLNQIAHRCPVHKTLTSETKIRLQ
jgi:putative redox protein